MIGIKKHGVGFEDRMGQFLIHDTLKSSLVVPIETRHVHFPTPLVADW
jgi:hypothetical protein